MDAGAAVDVNPDNFQTEVIERSQSVPVFVLFWAEQVEPSVQARALLEQLIGQYQGKAALALSDVAVDQTLAQHLRVQGLPSIRIVHQGKIVHQLDGPQDEAQLRAVLDQLTQSPADLLRGQLDGVLASGDWDTALAMLQDAVNREPGNPGFRVELADVLVRKGDLDGARTVLASIPEDTPERDRPQNRLELEEEAAGMPERGEIEAALAAEPDELEHRYQLAVRLAAEGDYAGALDAAMHVLRSDRSFRDDIGRLTMLRVFAVLGKGDPLAAQYRRKMFNFMH